MKEKASEKQGECLALQEKRGESEKEKIMDQGMKGKTAGAGFEFLKKAGTSIE